MYTKGIEYRESAARALIDALDNKFQKIGFSVSNNYLGTMVSAFERAGVNIAQAEPLAILYSIPYEDYLVNVSFSPAARLTPEQFVKRMGDSFAAADGELFDFSLKQAARLLELEDFLSLNLFIDDISILERVAHNIDSINPMFFNAYAAGPLFYDSLVKNDLLPALTKTIKLIRDLPVVYAEGSALIEFEKRMLGVRASIFGGKIKKVSTLLFMKTLLLSAELGNNVDFFPVSKEKILQANDQYKKESLAGAMKLFLEKKIPLVLAGEEGPRNLTISWDPQELLDLNAVSLADNSYVGIAPHNDDLMWPYAFLRAAQEQGAAVYKSILTDDYLGVDIVEAFLFLSEYFFENTKELSRDKLRYFIDNEILSLNFEDYKNMLSLIRRREWDKVPFEDASFTLQDKTCFTASRIPVDPENKKFSYLATYYQPASVEYRSIFNFYRELFLNIRAKYNKPVVIFSPFCYDNHPVHRMAAGLLIDVFEDLVRGIPKAERDNNYQLWMYFSGDAAYNFPATNRQWDISDGGKTDKYNAWLGFRSQLLNHLAYSYNNKFYDAFNFGIATDPFDEELYGFSIDSKPNNALEKFLKLNID